ncbi:methyltransferase-like protein 7A [Panicum miliaceum]|uniref:Methyltransferase-like protein 7A n=1 Tax=Panicum miliaceum TaxID=4540 RepID=A0A3L6RUR4_PANMI|nr:methyltransferase-like protein 7A [Panicum miliaceum]
MNAERVPVRGKDHQLGSKQFLRPLVREYQPKFHIASGTKDSGGSNPVKSEATGTAKGGSHSKGQRVAEALPAEDNSMDAVIGTLVLCSVNDIGMALREIYRVLKPGGLYLFVEHVAAPDGSLLRFVQGTFDPLQQFAADGCHLTRKTGENIRDVGFSSLSLDSVRLSNAYIISPHVYGVAYK